MRSGPQIPSVLDAVGQLFSYALLVAAAVAALVGLFILLFRIPARAKLVIDGRHRAEKDLRASIILNGVYTNGVKSADYKVDDTLQFVTRTGEKVQVGVRRPMSRDPATLIWYSPRDPKRVTTRSPLRFFAFASACLATAIWLRW